MLRVDPYSILGVPEGVDERRLTAAYREQAKRWHPDRGGGEEAERRMAEINAAYDLLRADIAQQAQRRRGRCGGAAPAAAGCSEPVRRALGPELLDALAQAEAVRLVTPASTWASPRAVLAVTERRLLWLLDDAAGRARALARLPRRGHLLAAGAPAPVATLSLRTVGGRRHSFADLRPPTAAAIERHLREAVHASSS